MPETAGFFPANDGTPLYGVFHAPGARACNPPSERPEDAWTAAVRGAIVIAPPLFEERKSAYGALTQLARALAAAGYGVLRFDYRGSGESGGESGQRRWPHLAEDLDAASQAARKQSGRSEVSVIGVRLGATLALTEATHLQPERIVAIAPILKGQTEARLWRLRSKMRSELGAQEAGGDARGPVGIAGVPVAHPSFSAQEAGGDARGPVVDLDGFPVHPAFFDDLQKVDTDASPAPIHAPALIVQVSHRESAAPDYKHLTATLGSQAKLVCVKALPFWERIENADTGEIQQQVLAFFEKEGRAKD